MKRIFLKLAVSLVTFSIGVSATGIFWLYIGPDVTLPEVEKFDMRSSCFPGHAVWVSKSPYGNTYFPLPGLAGTMFAGRGYIYSRHLEAMNEPPLGTIDNEDEAYRFLWLRTFHNPVVIHIWRTGDRHVMVVKRLNGRGGYDPGSFDLYWKLPLSENDWDAFIMHLEHSEFWLMPAPEPGMMAMDGAQWVMEGYRDGRYHVVDRQSPAPSAYADAGLYLLRLSGLLAETPANEVY